MFNAIWLLHNVACLKSAIGNRKRFNIANIAWFAAQHRLVDVMMCSRELGICSQAIPLQRWGVDDVNDQPKCQPPHVQMYWTPVSPSACFPAPYFSTWVQLFHWLPPSHLIIRPVSKLMKSWSNFLSTRGPIYLTWPRTLFEVCCTAEIVIRDLIALHAGIPYPPEMWLRPWTPCSCGYHLFKSSTHLLFMKP